MQSLSFLIHNMGPLVTSGLLQGMQCRKGLWDIPASPAFAEVPPLCCSRQCQALTLCLRSHPPSGPIYPCSQMALRLSQLHLRRGLWISVP